MKKYLSLISVPAVNTGALIYSLFPSYDLLEEIFKLLLLIATLLYTLIKIFLLILNELKSRTKKVDNTIKDKTV